MNIQNVGNNAGNGGLIDGAKPLEQKKAEGARQTDRQDNVRQDAVESRQESTAVQQTRDEYLSTDRARTEELASKIGETEPEIRENLVQQAIERVQSGFYDSDEVLNSLAEKITDVL